MQKKNRNQRKQGDRRNPPEESIPLSGDHSYALDAATGDEASTLGEAADTVMGEIDRYTEDEDVRQDFAQRQALNTGRERLAEELQQHHSKSPQLSGGDIDAAWQDADVSGEEAVGGSVPTPDQDVVDELGKAVGIHYDLDEPLATADKLEQRDRDRAELSPSWMERDPEDDADFEAGLDEEEDDLEPDLDDEDLEDELEDALDEPPLGEGVDDLLEDEDDFDDQDVDEELDDLEAELDLEDDLEDYLEEDFDDDDED